MSGNFNAMDLYTYLALGGLVYCVLLFSWVMVNLSKWNKQTRGNDEY